MILKSLTRLFRSFPAPFFLIFIGGSVVFSQFFYYQQLHNSSSDVAHVTKKEERISNNHFLMWRILPKFGYNNLFSDWVFLSFLQYFGDSDFRKETGYSLSSEYFEDIVDNDPYFIDSYIFLVNTVSMYEGQPKRSISLIEKGLTNMRPNAPEHSYLIWRYKATDELLFLGNIKSAQKSYETAATWAENSDDENATLVATLSRKTAEFLATDPNSKSAQIGAWSEVLLRATDDNIRKEAIANIESLGGRVLFAEDGQVTVRYKADNK